MYSYCKFLAIIIASILASGDAIAQASFFGYAPYEYAPTPPNPPPGRIQHGFPVQELDWYRYDFSGTRGRIGLGADPAHPEGPGNFSSPGR